MRRPTRRQALWLAVIGAALLAVIALVVGMIWPHSPEPAVRELTRAALDLREGKLYATGEPKPFEGRLIENYAGGARKLTIEVRAGQLNGRSAGYYPNGQMEVDEQFVAGVSHGTRTRWHANGNRKSLAQIEDGKVIGPYIEWHENGHKSVEMTVREDGKPEGIVEAWHPSGALKSRIQFEDGQQVSRKFFDDPGMIAENQEGSEIQASNDHRTAQSIDSKQP